MILLEGPDGGGKTTVAKTLFSRYSYQHNGPPPKGSPADTFWWQLEGLHPQVVPSAYNEWIVDRNWPSEQIYHRFAGRPHVFHPFAQRMFERYMLSVDGVVVICLPPYDVAYETWRRRADAGLELLTEDDQFATMYEFYRSWHESTCLPVFTYDYTQDTDFALTNGVGFYHVGKPNPAPGIVYGNPAARILIVGEQYNVRARPQGPHIPFVGTGRNGFWLAHQLELLGIPESELAWVNAVQPDGRRTEFDLGAFNFDLAITLGATAKNWVYFQRTIKNWLAFPHPAFWTRFKSKEQYPLLDHKVYLRELAGV
jgi:hypothetical protein